MQSAARARPRHSLCPLHAHLHHCGVQGSDVRCYITRLSSLKALAGCAAYHQPGLYAGSKEAAQPHLEAAMVAKQVGIGKQARQPCHKALGQFLRLFACTG